jgi:tetratricopeptide (TPR) repeat protein
MYHQRQASYDACLIFMSQRRVLLPTFLLVALAVQFCFSQTAKPITHAAGTQTVQHALELARLGRCGEALPILKRTISQQSENAAKRDVGLAGVRCAMVTNQFGAANDFLRALNRDFPNDPEVLYVTVQTYTDLATNASQQLATMAPNSPQAHELNAEALEMQGKWNDAAKEYQSIVQKNPTMPGIHFKIGRLLLSQTNPPPDAGERAKKEFQQELEIDPSNAGAEYVLGELARQGQQWDEAIQHFSRAAKLEAGFGDAYLGWGLALIATKKFPEAVTPLQSAVKLEPMNPAAHYNLAMAYSRTGRKQEADKEFAIHRQMVQKNSAEGGQPAQSPSEAPQ